VIVLDTHAWVWWVTKPERLSLPSRAAIEQAPAVGIAAISCWELAMLVQKRRLGLDRDVLTWVRQAFALPRATLLPLIPEIAVAAVRLPENFQGDPADRLIVATALHHGAALVTKDQRIRKFTAVRTI